MKKLIILFVYFIVSCNYSGVSSKEKAIIDLVKKQDNASLLNMINDGILKQDFKTSDQNDLLHLSVIYNNLALLQSLVEQGFPLDGFNKNGDTPLMLSILRGNEVFAENLIDYQTDPNVQDNNGDTALILSAKKGLDAIVVALVEKTDNKTDPTISNSENKTAIDYLDPNSLGYSALSRYTQKWVIQK